MKEVLRFPINKPTLVALRFEAGKRVDGRYGEQIMYALMDNRLMYVPPCVEARLQELAIPAGETFEITKQEVRSGTRKWVEWNIRRLPQQPTLEEETEQPVPARANGNNGHRARAGKDAADADTAGAAAEANLPVPVPDPITASGAQLMEIALSGAAQIAQRVERQAAAKRYSLRFSSEDIRAIGLTLFIQAARESGSRWPQ